MHTLLHRATISGVQPMNVDLPAERVGFGEDSGAVVMHYWIQPADHTLDSARQVNQLHTIGCALAVSLLCPPSLRPASVKRHMLMQLRS